MPEIAIMMYLSNYHCNLHHCHQSKSSSSTGLTSKSNDPLNRARGGLIVGLIGRPYHGRGGEINTNCGPYNNQRCLTFILDFEHFKVDLYPNVARVKKENETGEAKCVEEGSFQPTWG